MQLFDSSARQEALGVFLDQRSSVVPFLCLEAGEKQNSQLLFYKALQFHQGDPYNSIKSSKIISLLNHSNPRLNFRSEFYFLFLRISVFKSRYELLFIENVEIGCSNI